MKICCENRAQSHGNMVRSHENMLRNHENNAGHENMLRCHETMLGKHNANPRKTCYESTMPSHIYTIQGRINTMRIRSCEITMKKTHY